MKRLKKNGDESYGCLSQLNKDKENLVGTQSNQRRIRHFTGESQSELCLFLGVRDDNGDPITVTVCR